MRFWAFQGVGYTSRPAAASNSPKAGIKWPWAVLQGPSGQLVQLNPPSGLDPSFWVAIETTQNHSCIGWKHRHLAFVWSAAPGTAESMRAYVWNPQSQLASKINPSTTVNEDGENVRNQVIEDGYNWTKWNILDERREYPVMLSLHDGVFWVKPIIDYPISHFGVYKAHRPHKLSTSGYFNSSAGNYGGAGTGGDAGWSRLPEGTQGTGGIHGTQDGVDFREPHNGAYPTNLSLNPCEIVRHRDTMYVIWQYAIQGMTIGCKGNYVHHDFGVDNKVGGAGNTEDYQQRNTNGVLGATMRSACVHQDQVFMLTNTGLVYEIRPGGLIQKADLTDIGTPWASGITGGSLSDNVAPTNYRPLLRSFNNQLHAFLNFRTTYKLARGKENFNSKTQGAGVCWFTSFDGVNWQDRTEMLPSSGIITPSGNMVFLETWKAQTHPYVHSAYMETNYPSGYGPKSPQVNFLGQSAPQPQGAEGQPSGYKQSGFLPFWSSGNLLDNPNTVYSSLKTPLSRGMLSGCLFPTFVSYPSGYAFVNPLGGDASGFRTSLNGVWRPVHGNGLAAGASGWDYTGCSNYHIGGVVDNDVTGQPLLRLAFSRNFTHSTPLSIN